MDWQIMLVGIVGALTVSWLICMGVSILKEESGRLNDGFYLTALLSGAIFLLLTASDRFSYPSIAFGSVLSSFVFTAAHFIIFFVYARRIQRSPGEIIHLGYFLQKPDTYWLTREEERAHTMARIGLGWSLTGFGVFFVFVGIIKAIDQFSISVAD